MARREFTPTVYAQIVHRAIVDGQIVCEGCGLFLGKKPYHVDHTRADGLEVDKTRKLTAADGKLLGVECCHKPKTKIDVGLIAEAKRIEAKHLGMTTRKPTPIKSAPFQKTEKAMSRLAKPPLPPRNLYEGPKP